MTKKSWTGIPAQRSGAMGLKVRMRLIIGIALVAALLGPLAIVVTVLDKSTGVTTSSNVSDESSALAMIVAQDYLAGRDTQVQVATGTGVESNAVNSALHGLNATENLTNGALAYTSISYAGSEELTDSVRTFKLHKFFVNTTTGLLQLTVTTTLNDKNNPVLAAHPSLLPAQKASAKAVAPIDYTDIVGKLDNMPAGLPQQVLKWATAFAADDRVVLKDVVNYPGIYPGLGGFTVRDAKVIIVSVIPGTTVGQLNVRVRFTLVKTSSPTFQVISDYDLLVNPEGDLPKILAWGPAGQAGGALIAYSNNLESK